MSVKNIVGTVIGLILSTAAALGGTFTLSTAFTYQGRLVLNGEPVDSTANFLFRLYDNSVGGNQIGNTISVSNVVVSDGLFTAQVNFGADAFNGSQRWLEAAVCTPGGCGLYVTLSPRQPISVAPYALQTRGMFVNAAGQVGINTETPLSRLTVSGDVTLANDVDSLRFSDTDGTNTPMIQMFTSSTTNGNRMVLGHSPGFPTWGLEYLDSIDQFRFRRDTGSALTVDLVSRFVGVRTNNPDVPLHVDGGSDAGPAGGGYLAVGSIASTNVVIDNNEIMARNNGSVAPLSLNASGGDVYMMQLGAGSVGIGTNNPAATLHVLPGTDASPGGGGHIVAGAVNGLNVVIDNNEIMARNNGSTATLSLNFDGGTVVTGSHLDVGGHLDVAGNLFVNTIDATGNAFVDGALIAGFLNSTSTGSHAANIQRNGSDGVLIFFWNDGVDIGSISMSGQNVSYNPFTGSHFAWIEDADPAALEHGTLMRLTGTNHRHRNCPDAEIVYGVTPTSTANDPACLGAYFSLHDEARPASLENPHLIAAVGNSDLWITDAGAGNILPGDYLISSSVAGCAMRDDPTRYPIGHIVARAGEAVDWASIQPDADGVRRTRISVLFESFVRHGDANAIAQQLDAQQRRIADLETQVRSLQQTAGQVSSLSDALLQLQQRVAFNESPQAAAVKAAAR